MIENKTAAAHPRFSAHHMAAVKIVRTSNDSHRNHPPSPTPAFPRMIRPCRVLFIIAATVAASSGAELSPQELAAIDLSDARDDHGWVAPVSAGLTQIATDPERKAMLDALIAKLAMWSPGYDANPETRVGALLNAAALVDLGRGACEGEFAWTVLDRLQHDPERAAIVQATAQIASARDAYMPVNCLLALELTTTETTERVHARMALYARKLLGRLLGSLPVRQR